jgi:L-rhamnose mutarotase
MQYFEVLSQINKVNVRNYSLSCSEGILFSYYEYIGNDYANDMKAIGDETTIEWRKLTQILFRSFFHKKKKSGGQAWNNYRSLKKIKTLLLK